MIEVLKADRKNLVLRVLLAALLAAGGFVFFWLFPLKLISRLAARLGHASPCPAALSWLVDNRVRRTYMRPVLDRIGIQSGERVLELGPGPGAFTVGAAERAGPEGSLVAVDIQPEMIDQVKRRVRDAGLTNVEALVASAYALPLDEGSVDRAFAITVLPEIPNPSRALAELHRVLKPEGALSITEEFYDPDYLFFPETVRLVEAAGFRLDRRFGNWMVYTANFRKVGPAHGRHGGPDNPIRVLSLPLPLRLGRVNSYLLRTADGFVLIDTGGPNARAELEGRLAAEGCTPGSLRLVLLTHGDFDHIGNAAHLRARFGARLAMHRDDAGMAEGGDMFWSRSTGSVLLRRLVPILFRFSRANRFRPDLLVEDGDSLSQYGLNARVLSLPGHSRGSVGILTAGGDLFCGDLLENSKGPATNPIMDDRAACEASLGSLRSLEVKRVYPGHGEPFETKSRTEVLL